jgi:prevent-host-death family protein
MPRVPQRELCNNSGEILRQAEVGERFTITVSGRPVAELGPVTCRQWVDTSTLGELFALPANLTLAETSPHSTASCTIPGSDDRRPAEHISATRPATARVHGVPLLTHNTKDFTIVEDLVEVRRSEDQATRAHA